jgi:hypothetical protein
MATWAALATCGLIPVRLWQDRQEWPLQRAARRSWCCAGRCAGLAA